MYTSLIWQPIVWLMLLVVCIAGYLRARSANIITITRTYQVCRDKDGKKTSKSKWFGIPLSGTIQIHGNGLNHIMDYVARLKESLYPRLYPRSYLTIYLSNGTRACQVWKEAGQIKVTP